MKKGYKKLLLFCLLLIILSILNIIFNTLNSYQYILFLIITFVSSIFLIGFEKDNYIFKKDMIIIVIISCIFYYILTYASGLLIGFIKNIYSLSIVSILKNIIPLFLIICLEELIRYNLVRKGSRNKLILFLTILILILMDITLIIQSFDLWQGSSLVKFIFVYIIPSIFKNTFLTFLVYKGGYKPAIIYRIIMELTIYILPVFANLGLYLESSIKVLFPSLLMFIVYKMTNVIEERELIGRYKYKKIWIIVLILLITLMIGINSGMFKYYSVTIGSASMAPKINKGDVIIIEKIKKSEIKNLKKGDILVFNKGETVIVHRVADIKKVNSQYLFYTKGDANESMDGWITEEKDIVGITEFKISFIGYPTVWLSEFIKNTTK